MIYKFKCKCCRKIFAPKRQFPSFFKNYTPKYCSIKCRGKCANPPHFFGSKSSHWKGGLIGTTQGYLKRLLPSHPRADKDGYVMEHYLTAERALGRFITKNEVIHHINKIKTDNYLKNLYLFPSSKEHGAYHMKQYFYGYKPLKSNLLVVRNAC
jgi:hypothetical protein